MDSKKDMHSPSYNTAYTPRADALALRDIAPYGRNIVYAENVYEIARIMGGKNKMPCALIFR